MAIYHCSIKHGSKGNEASGTAKALYICREGKYADKPDLEYKESGNMPTWAQKSARAFWKASDENERANGRVWTEIEISLPRESTEAERKELIQGFIAEQLQGHPYTVAVHNPKALDGEEQPHAHVIFSERKLDGIERDQEHFFKRANKKEPEKGGTAKDRKWNDRDKVQEVREAWEQHFNKAVIFSELHVSCKSLKAQGIDREPEPKLGPKGVHSPAAERVKETRKNREELQNITYEMRKLEKEIEAEQKVKPTPQDIVVSEKSPESQPQPTAEIKTEKIQEVVQTPDTTRSADPDELANVPRDTISSIPVPPKATGDVEPVSPAQPQQLAPAMSGGPQPPQEKDKPSPQQPAVELSSDFGVKEPAPAKGEPAEKSPHTRLTEINQWLDLIEKKYTPTAEQIAADNKTRFPDLQGWKDNVKNIEAKYPDFNQQVKDWQQTGEERGWKAGNPGLLPSKEQKAWQQKGANLEAERVKMVEDKKQAVEAVKAWEKYIRENEGAELRKEAAKRRNADPEYQKLKIEQSAIKAAIRDAKVQGKGKDKDQGRSR